MEQGYQSTVSLKDNRITKYINQYNIYNEEVDPWKEFKILEFISSLSPYFPQNVVEKGPYEIEYDFVPGKRLTTMKESYFNEIRSLYEILNINGFAHGDPGYNNFIIDEYDHVHIVDFGQAYTTDDRGGEIIGTILEKYDENGHLVWEYIPPSTSYEKHVFPISKEFTSEMVDLLDGLYVNAEQYEEWMTKLFGEYGLC